VLTSFANVVARDVPHVLGDGLEDRWRVCRGYALVFRWRGVGSPSLSEVVTAVGGIDSAAGGAVDTPGSSLLYVRIPRQAHVMDAGEENVVVAFESEQNRPVVHDDLSAVSGMRMTWRSWSYVGSASQRSE
jgi:hypothetical protein